MRRRRIRSIATLAAFAALGLVPTVASAFPVGTTLLVSRPDGTGPVPPASDASSSFPLAVSADGRYVAFLSDADGLAAGSNPTTTNLFVRDTLAKTTTLASRSDGPNGAAAEFNVDDPAIAVGADGHVLAVFTTASPNLADHSTGPVTPNGRTMVWLRDVTAGTTTLISRADGDGAPGNNSSFAPAIGVTPGGPVVAFASVASNLGVSSGTFLRTVDAKQTQLAAASTGELDLRVMQSEANTLCTLPTGCVEIALATRNMTLTGDTVPNQHIVILLAAAPTSGGTTGAFGAPIAVIKPNLVTFANGDATEPRLSADGEAVAYLNTATNLTTDSPNPSPSPGQAYVTNLHNPPSQQTILMSRGTNTAPVANDAVFHVALGGTIEVISGNPVFRLRVAFATAATNLGGSGFQVYTRDLSSTAVLRITSRAAGAAGAIGNAGSNVPAMSADGNVIGFVSTATNLGDGVTRALIQVHLRRLPAETIEHVSRPSGTAPFAAGTEFAGLDSHRSVSADGRFVAFISNSPSLSRVDDDRFTNVFVRDLLLGRTILVSRASGAAGAVANGQSVTASLSADGRRVLFTSSATNLASGTPASTFQVYVRDLVANTTTLVSRAAGAKGAIAAQGGFGGEISRDGRVVIVTSNSALDPAGADGKGHVYVRNLDTGIVRLADRDNGAAGAVPAFDASGAVMSSDGRRVAWSSRAPIAGAPNDGFFHVFVRDLAAGTTTLASRAEGLIGASAAEDAIGPALDGDGDTVAFLSRADNLVEPITNQQVFVRNTTLGQTDLVSRRRGANGLVAAGAGFPSLDDSGRRVLFPAASLGDSNQFQVYVRDLATAVNTLVSRANGTAGAPADGGASTAGMSPSGDCVAFSATARNLADGFASTDFSSVHLRVVRNQCAPAATLRSLRLSKKRFPAKGRNRGTAISFSLSFAEPVVLRFERKVAGHKRGTRCLVGFKKGQRRCTIYRLRGTRTVNAKRGANRVRFTGVVAGKALARGSYRLTVTPVGGTPRRISFTIR